MFHAGVLTSASCVDKPSSSMCWQSSCWLRHTLLFVTAPHPAGDVQVNGALPANWDATAWDTIIETLSDINAEPDVTLS